MIARILSAALLLAIVLLPQAAHAHVLLKDDAGRAGAILHVYPDDDPVAGQRSNLLFDIRMPADDPVALTGRLHIEDATGERVVLPVTLSKNSGGADFTFPAQGAYDLRLTVSSAGQTYTFDHAQRVTRGAAASALDRPRYGWAEAALVFSGCTAVLLAIIVFNRRSEIVRQSSW